MQNLPIMSQLRTWIKKFRISLNVSRRHQLMHKLDQKIVFRIYPLMQQPYQDHFYQFIFYLPLPNLISHILSNISRENKLDINNSNLDTPTLSLSSICSIYLSKCPYRGHSTTVWIQSVEYFRSIGRLESVTFIFLFLYTSY